MKLSIPYVSIKYIRNKNFRRQCPLIHPKSVKKRTKRRAGSTRSGDGQRLTRSCMLLFLPAMPPVKPTIVFNNKLY